MANVGHRLAPCGRLKERNSVKRKKICDLLLHFKLSQSGSSYLTSVSGVDTYVGRDLYWFLSKMEEEAEGQQSYKTLVEDRAESPLKLWLSDDYRGSLWLSYPLGVSIILSD